MLSIILVFTLNFSPPVQAEYRVFLLRILKQAPPEAATDNQAQAPAPPAEPIIVREFPSTLDPLQYPTYYPIAEDEQVVYIDTWRCRGRTNEKPLCPNPRLAEEANTAETEVPPTAPALPEARAPAETPPLPTPTQP